MHRRISILNLIISTTIICLITPISHLAQAAKVTKVQGNQILIELDPNQEQIAVGEKYFVLIENKKKGIVQIAKVKNNRAIGKLLKGQATVDSVLAKAGSNKAAAKETPQTKESANEQDSNQNTSNPFKRLSVGVLGGISLNSQTVTATVNNASESVAMAGTGINVKGYADLPVMNSLGLLGRVGFEQFMVSGSSSVRSVKTEISYGSADLLLRYNLLDEDFVPFAVAGLGLYFPLTKTSDTLDTNRISTTTVFYAGGGFHFALNEAFYLTAMGEYSLFPPSSEVKTSTIALRAGAGFAF